MSLVFVQLCVGTSQRGEDEEMGEQIVDGGMGKKNAVWGGGRWLELWKGRKPDCVSLYFVYGSYRMVHVWQQVL